MKKMKLFIKTHWKKILWGAVLTVVTFGTYGLIKVLTKAKEGS